MGMGGVSPPVSALQNVCFKQRNTRCDLITGVGFVCMKNGDLSLDQLHLPDG